jgi:glycosyltransferase
MVIITLTKNSSKTITKTIKSIEEQTLKNILWIVIDENSNDTTLELVEKSKINKEIIKTDKKGIFPCYNYILDILMKRNLNEVIFFLHSDDLIYNSDVLNKVENLFKKYSLMSLCGDILFFKNDNTKYFRKWLANYKKKQIKIEKNLYKFKTFSKKDLIFGWSFPHTSFFFHSKIISKIPKYKEELKTSSDYGWSVEILLQNKITIYYLNDYIVKMKAGGTSTNYLNIFNQFVNDFKLIKELFYKNKKDIFFCLIAIFSKKIRKIKQFF